jgi:hypothetical protein
MMAPHFTASSIPGGGTSVGSMVVSNRSTCTLLAAAVFLETCLEQAPQLTKALRKLPPASGGRLIQRRGSEADRRLSSRVHICPNAPR